MVLMNWLRPFVKAEVEVSEAFRMLRPCNMQTIKTLFMQNLN